MRRKKEVPAEGEGKGKKAETEGEGEGKEAKREGTSEKIVQQKQTQRPQKRRRAIECEAARTPDGAEWWSSKSAGHDEANGVDAKRNCAAEAESWWFCRRWKLWELWV